MFYSITSTLAFILNLIISWETLIHIRSQSVELEGEQKFLTRYRHFLITANCYFFADVAWGILYEHHDIDALFPILYFDRILYFLLMFMTMLTWMRSLVAYLGHENFRSKILMGTVWTMFTLGVIYLLINRFHPFIFSFNEEHEYIMESGRHIAFILQIILYMMATIYMLFIASKSYGIEKIRYRAIGLTSLVMDLFLMLQIFDYRFPSYAAGLIIGICVIHSFVEASERKEKEIYDNIAKSLAEDYEATYYINIETGEFREFSKSAEYESMKVPFKGKNFYEENSINIDKYVHPDDREFARELYLKETMLKNLENRKSYSYKYRVMIDGHPRRFQFVMMRANDNRHLILSEKDIDDEITTENMLLESKKKQITFTEIAEILAVNYDVIYYVDANDSSWISFECRNIYGKLKMQKSGNDFFADSKNDISNIVHKSDRDQLLEFISREHITTTLKTQKSCSLDYRIIAFKKLYFVRMTVQKTANESHYIIGIENIDDEVKKEKQHLKALNTEKELARRDELTGVKNKTAYNELEKSVQENIDKGMDYLPFGLVICDTNELKKINDTEGHVAGDEYIKKSAKLLCDNFSHSPVFRVGGDEFVVFLRGEDYSNREKLMNTLQAQVLEKIQSKSGPILASGMAEYIPESDTFVSEIFDRADKAMYKNKRELKKAKK